MNFGRYKRFFINFSISEKNIRVFLDVSQKINKFYLLRACGISLCPEDVGP